MNLDATIGQAPRQLQSAVFLDDLLMRSHEPKASTFCADFKHETSLDRRVPRSHFVLMHIGDRIAAARKAKGWSQGRLGDAVHQGQTTISSWERGRTEPGRDDVEKVAEVLGISRAELEGVANESRPSSLVRIIGRVGADASGTVLLAYADDSYDMAPMPAGGTSKTVALEVNGWSMQFYADDGSLIYFNDQKVEPTPDLIGEVCAVETEDGRVLVKRLKRGSAPGLYDLESIVGAPIKDVRLRWAAEIISVTPPRQARRIIVRSSEHVA